MSTLLNAAFDSSKFSQSTVMRRVPGSCGELAQGAIDGRDFLVSAPIDLYANVSVALNSTGVVNVANEGHYQKLIEAVSSVIRMSKEPYLGANIEVFSRIPRGKGMASSTAELAAAVSATAELVGERLDPDAISKILIETDRSTDGLYHPGVVKVDHLAGEVLEFFGKPPSLGFVVIDQGGEVRTMDFDRDRARFVAKENEDLLRRSLTLLRKGFLKQNPALIAKGATLSAKVNQSVLHKPLFDRLLPKIREWGALGINCAHTGTVLGVMFDPRKVSPDYLMGKIQAEVEKESVLGFYTLRGGENRETGFGTGFAQLNGHAFQHVYSN